MSSRVNPSAGVYTYENDMSVRAQAASTSIVAIVGEASRGIVNTPFDVFEDSDLLKEFGEPDAQRFGFGLYCAKRALLGTSHLKYVRVVSEDALTAGAYLTVDDESEVQPKLSINVFDNGSNQALGVYDPMNTLGFAQDDPATAKTLAFFCASNPGEWNKEISIVVRPSNPDGISLEEERFYNPLHFIVEVYINYNGINSPVAEAFLVSRDYELNGDGDQMHIEQVINHRSQYIRVKNNPHCGPVKIKREAHEFLDGGTDGSRPTEAAIRNAWELFTDPEVIDVNLLCNAGYTTAVIQRFMLNLAERRGDCLAVLDVPKIHLETSRAVNYVINDLNYGSSYGGIYAPYLSIRDTVNSKNVDIPPSGDVCAAMANTDKTRATWFAAAGLRRGQVRVLDLTHKYKSGARGALDRAHINVIRSIPGRGFVIMGQDTLQRHASAFSNINVRRLVNLVKKSLANAVTVSNFDPNDSITRITLKNIVDSFLRPIKGGRGLNAFDTVCDERNNKPDQIANGDMYLDVFMDPVIPSKRLHLNTHIMPTGTFFSES